MRRDRLQMIMIGGNLHHVGEEEADHYHIEPDQRVVRKSDIHFSVFGIGFARDEYKELNKSVNRLFKLMKKLCRGK